MPSDDYAPVPLLEEEKQTETGPWRKRRSSESSLGTFFQTENGRRIEPHWIWIAHVASLSISITLFTLAFCLHNARPSNLTVTTEYSTYCKCHSILNLNIVIRDIY